MNNTPLFKQAGETRLGINLTGKQEGGGNHTGVYKRKGGTQGAHSTQSHR